MQIPTIPGAEERNAKLQRLLKAAQERYDKMTPAEQASMRAQQAIGYVVAELVLGVFDPEPTDKEERAKSALTALENIEKVLDLKIKNTDYMLVDHSSRLLPKARFELKTTVASARRQLAQALAPSAES